MFFFPIVGDIIKEITVRVIYNLAIRVLDNGSGLVTAKPLDIPIQLGAKKIVFPETIYSSPAIAVSRDQIYFAWRASDNRIVLMSYGGRPQGYHKKVLDEATDHQPALAYNGNSLFLAWRGVDDEHRLNIMPLSLDLFPRKKNILPEWSPNGPSLAADSRNLYLAWEGGDERHMLNLARLSTTGYIQQKQILHSDWSPNRPAIAYSSGKVFLAWRGGDERYRLNNLVLFSDLKGHSTKYIWEESVSSAPAITTCKDQAFLSWVSLQSDHKIKIASMEDKHILELGEWTTSSISLASKGDNLYLSWRGEDDAHSLCLLVLAT